MEGTEYKDRESVLKRAQEAIGLPLGEIDKTGRIMTGKGAIGTVLEESWFGYTPNSEAEPDFPEAGVELKVTPYIKTSKGVSAKERLVCNIINYMTEHQKTFETSDFWMKCNSMLIMSYEHRKDVPKTDYTIDRAVLFSFPEEDLQIIKRDWEIIMEKVRRGEAHLITEGDTLYLAACTKGATSASVRPQPYSSIPAKQRAYSLKSSYMTRLLRSYVFGDKEDEHIIKDWHELSHQSLEQIIIQRVAPYKGRTQAELKATFGIESDSKNLNEILLANMLGVKGRLTNTDEFKNANILPKTIRIEKNGRIRESMSFPTFKFTEIVEEEWEESTLKNYLEPKKFLFVIFRETEYGEYAFSGVQFWNIPAEDLEEVHRVWERTKSIIEQGVLLVKEKNIVHNNLPKQSESRVAHVRPHARDSKDTYPLPDGREMPKQCFWFNRDYVRSIVSNDVSYKFNDQRGSMVAEKTTFYSK